MDSVRHPRMLGALAVTCLKAPGYNMSNAASHGIHHTALGYTHMARSRTTQNVLF